MEDGSVVLKIRKKDAESLSFPLADALCWLNGFEAGSGERTPISKEPMLQLNSKLKNLLQVIEEQPF
jgi:hypothetical protein